MHVFFQNPEIIFYHFFHIFNLDIFWVIILQKRIGSRYLDPVTPTTVLSRSFWNFTGALRMVWICMCFFQNLVKLFFITGFLLQYLGKWYRTNGPLVNFTIFNTSNKNKARDINSPWNLLVVLFVFFFFAKNVGNSFTTPPLFKESFFSYSPDLVPCDFFLFSETEIRVCVTVKPVLGGGGGGRGGICNLANNSAVKSW